MDKVDDRNDGINRAWIYTSSKRWESLNHKYIYVNFFSSIIIFFSSFSLFNYLITLSIPLQAPIQPSTSLNFQPLFWDYGSNSFAKHVCIHSFQSFLIVSRNPLLIKYFFQPTLRVFLIFYLTIQSLILVNYSFAFLSTGYYVPPPRHASYLIFSY
jgi:hypothetical protein